MHRFTTLALAALALASTAALRAEEPAAAPAATSETATTAAPAAPAASAAEVATAASAAAKPAQHCWKEYRVGSNMPVTHCEAPEDAMAAANRAEHLRQMQDTMIRNQAFTAGKGG